MQLKTLLALPTLADLQIFAGQAGLKHEINSVNLITNAVPNTLSQNQQLLMLSNQASSQVKTNFQPLLTTLADHHYAGLALDVTNLTTNEATQLKTIAEKLSFPILAIDPAAVLPALVQTILTALLTSRTAQLNQIVTANQALANLILKDQTGTTLLNKSEELIGHALFWMDSHFRVFYASSQIANQKGIITDYLRDQTKIDYFKLAKRLTVPFHKHELTIIPLFSAYQENKSFIGIYDLDPHDADDQMLVQIVINSLSFVNSRIDMGNETRFRNQSGFFLNVMDDGLSHDLLIKMLKERNIDASTKFRCAASFVVTQHQGLLNSRLLEQVQQLTLWFVKEYQVPVIVFSLKQQLILLIDERQNPAHFLEALIKFVQPKLQKNAHFVIGYSYSTLPLTELATIYNEAAEALSLSESLANPISMYRPKYVKELLSLIPTNESQSFVERVLGGLTAGIPVNEQRNLLHTLQGYFFYHQNIAEVANHLFVHRNTVIYRLKKIEKLLGLNLNNPEETQTLELAILLWANQNPQDLPQN